MTDRPRYSVGFFDDITTPSITSARIVVPMLVDLVHPGSVVDVGCGRGAWLRSFLDCGVPTVVGYDGNYVSRDELLIPAETFEPRDLFQPLVTHKTFDLAVCLEVAEHLPDARSAGLVADLTKLAPVVAFSAAIPGQGGHGHINERWPEYWSGRFAVHGYEPLDCIRPRIAVHPDVAWWFRQNLMLFVASSAFERHPQLAAVREVCRDRRWEWVHDSIVRREPSLRALLRDLPRAAAQTVLARARSWRSARSRGQ